MANFDEFYEKYVRLMRKHEDMARQKERSGDTIFGIERSTEIWWRNVPSYVQNAAPQPNPIEEEVNDVVFD
jgi:hypothetical protein